MLEKFDQNDALSIKNRRHLSTIDRSIEPNFTAVDSNYGYLNAKFTQLETQVI